MFFQAMFMAGYLILYKVLLPDSIGQVILQTWLFLKIFGLLIAKIFNNAVRRKTQNQNKFQNDKRK